MPDQPEQGTQKDIWLERLSRDAREREMASLEQEESEPFLFEEGCGYESE